MTFDILAALKLKQDKHSKDKILVIHSNAIIDWHLEVMTAPTVKVIPEVRSQVYNRTRGVAPLPRIKPSKNPALSNQRPKKSKVKLKIIRNLTQNPPPLF